MFLETTARNALVGAFGNLFASGSKLRFRTAAPATVATLNLNTTPFGAPATGVITANAISPDTNAVGGVTTTAILMSVGDVTQATMSVGTSAAEIILSTTTIPAGATVSVSSLTITMPAT